MNGQETAKRFGFKIDNAPTVDSIRTTDILQKHQATATAPSKYIKDFLTAWVAELDENDTQTLRQALLDKIESL